MLANNYLKNLIKTTITLLCISASIVNAADLEIAKKAFKEENYLLAFSEYSELAENNNAEAQATLGHMYYHGIGVTQSYNEAAKWFIKAFINRNVWAAYYLAIMHYDGNGIEQDYLKSFELFYPLAEHGVRGAQFYVGLMYDNGKGVPQDYAQAVKWYSLAAEQDDADAQNNLAIMYALGQGVKKNSIQAHKWANIAAAKGDEDSAKLRDAIAKKMTQEQINEAQRLARDWKPTKASLSR